MAITNLQDTVPTCNVSTWELQCAISNLQQKNWISPVNGKLPIRKSNQPIPRGNMLQRGKGSDGYERIPKFIKERCGFINPAFSLDESYFHKIWFTIYNIWRCCLNGN